MARLKWHDEPSGRYNYGIENTVLYAPGRYGVIWEGIRGISIKPETTRPRTAYMDGEKIVNLLKAEEVSGSIEAYQSPIEFDRCDGTLFHKNLVLRNHTREPFSLSFMSRTEKGRRLHIVYNALAAPASKSYISSYEPQVDSLVWEFATRSVDLFGYSPTAYLSIDLAVAAPGPSQQVMDILYGTTSTQPRCPLPDEILTIFGVFEALQVIDHGDGSFTVMGSDSAVTNLGEGEFQLSASVVELLEEGTYQIHYTPQ